MKSTVNLALILLASGFCGANAWADDKNFGKTAPSENEIIQHFKSPESQAAPTPDSSDDYQDVSEGDLKNVRGLKKIDSVDQKTGRKRQLPTTIAEKAISLQILFDYNSATLTESAKAQLEPVGRALASGDLSGMKFRIEGHTDVIGGDEFNIELSRRRAEAVKQYLTQQFGVASAAIQIQGKGKSDLADAANPTSEANRRVRIVSLGK
jgi:outer membrane protein OmpA-like peptidoglycan-associated protein